MAKVPSLSLSLFLSLSLSLLSLSLSLSLSAILDLRMDSTLQALSLRTCAACGLCEKKSNLRVLKPAFTTQIILTRQLSPLAKPPPSTTCSPSLSLALSLSLSLRLLLFLLLFLLLLLLLLLVLPLMCLTITLIDFFHHDLSYYACVLSCYCSFCRWQYYGLR